MTSRFRLTIENEHGVIREAEHVTPEALLTVTRTDKGVVRISRTDDHTTVCICLPAALAKALAREILAGEVSA